MVNLNYSTLKIAWHPEKLESLLNGTIIAPIYVRLKPTNLCNHHCSFCSYEPRGGDREVRDRISNRKAQIPHEKILEILADFRDMGVKAVTYSGGGEPLIYPYILEALNKTLKYGIDLSIITNGQKLEGKKAEVLANAQWVRISSDASDAKSFSKIRKVPEKWFYELTENIRNFAKIKNPECELGINFIVHKQNSDQVYRSVVHFRDLGVNHVKITPQWIHPGFKEYHKPIMKSVLDQIRKAKNLQDSRFKVHDTYEADFSLCGADKRNYSKCYILQIVPVIGADSVVYFCHDKAYSSSGIIGSIKDKSFKNLWFSKEAKEIFQKFNPSKSCRHHCANDLRNMNIEALLACSGKTRNFI